MARRLFLLMAALSAVVGCSYESSGTTTTTVADVATAPPATSPAAIVVLDQWIEGSSLVVDSVSMPAAGFAVVREDDGGSPGPVLGVSELLPVGLVGNVTVPFSAPITETTTVHVAVQVDMNRDGLFTYEPPDFVDTIATSDSGEPASTTAVLSILAPLSPADVTIEEQRTDGTTLTVSSVTLPAPGFVAIQQNEAEQPGTVVAISGLLAAGTTSDLALTLDPPLRTTQLVYAVVYVDRNENGLFDPGDRADEIGVRGDGSPATASPVVTVVVRYPASVTASDQEITGEAVVLDGVELPSAGFVEILADDGGLPGTRLAVSALLQAGQAADVAVMLDPALTGDATLWARLWIDYDGDGVLSDGDVPALTDLEGDPVEESFLVTITTSS
jgi:hypothetical protein